MALFGSLFAHDRVLAPAWTYETKSGLLSGAAVYVNGAARAIIFGTRDGRVVCLDEQGRERWSFSTAQKLDATASWFVDETRVHAIVATPVIDDVDADGKPEVLVGSEEGILYCLDSSGRLKWKHDCGGDIRASPCVADIDGDGHKEVVIGSGNNRLTALSAAGKKLFEFQVRASVHSTPSVIPLPKRRTTLIIFGDDSGTLTAINAAQEVAWRIDLKAPITAAPVSFSDPEEERIVVGTHAGAVVCVSEHGEIVWEYRTGGSVYSAAAFADINGDGKGELVIGSCDDQVHAIGIDGKRLWTFAADFWMPMTPLTADLDGDGSIEVITGSYDHALYVLDGAGAYMMDYVPGIAGIVNQAGHYGSVLTADVGEQSGKARWTAKLSDMVVGATLLPTANGIGVVASTKDGKITLFSLRNA